MATVKSETMLDHTTLMDKYRSDITLLTDPNIEDEQKLKIVQTLNENFEVKNNSSIGIYEVKVYFILFITKICFEQSNVEFLLQIIISL